MADARRLSRLTVAFAALASAALAVAAFVAGSRLRFSLPSVEQLVAACGELVPAGGPAGLALVAVAALAAAVGVRGAAAAHRQLRAQRRLRRALRVIARQTDGAIGFWIVAGATPQAFCAGLLSPRIYVSEAAVAVLDRLELEAVLAHEEHHRRRRDPLRLATGVALAEAFFFVPALRRLHDRYRSLAEVAADEAAIKRTDRSTLAAALLRFSPAESSAAVGIAPERVDHLFGQRMAWDLPMLVLAGSLATPVALVGAAFAASATAGAVNVPMTLMCTCAMLAPLAMLGGAALVVRRQRA